MKGDDLILSGDIGGTKTVLALYESQGERLAPRDERVYASADHASFDSILRDFARGSEGSRLRAACFGAAGAVVDGRVATTNLPWVLEEGALAAQLGLPRVKLLNDLEAAAYGMLELAENERAVLQPARRARPQANAAVLAAGTGLGVAFLVWDGRRHVAVASEGGHVDFAPRGEEQIELLRFLGAELGHVSSERVLSGPGLHNIYRFLRARSGETEPSWLAERFARESGGAVVGEVGLAGDDSVCARSVELFAEIYGAQAGDLALQCVAMGGVYLAGGIAPKLLPALRAEGFLRAFCDKGRFAELLSGIEVSVSLDERAPLRGAARYASQLGG